MAEFKKIKYSDFIEPDKASFSDIVNAFEVINKAFDESEANAKVRGKSIEESLKGIAESAKTIKKNLGDVNVDFPDTSADLKALQKKLEKYKNEIEKLKKEKIELTETEKLLANERKKQQRLLAKEALQTDELIIANEKLNAKLQEEARERKKLIKIELTQNKVADENVKITEAQEGSINELNGVLSLNIAVYNKLTKEQRENEAIGGKLLKTIQEQDEALKALKKEYGDTKASVGNYKDSVIEALNETLPFSTSMQGLGTKLSSVKRGLRDTARGFGKFQTALLATGIGALVVALTSIKAALSSTREGSDYLRVGMASLSAQANVVTGTLGRWGNRILGISKANESAEDSTKGFIEQLKEAGRNATNIERLAIQYESLVKSLERSSESLKAQSQLFQDIQENDVKGYEARKDAAKSAQALILKSFEDELKIVKMRTKIALDRAVEIKRAGNDDREARLEYQEILKQNADLEAEFVDFVRNQSELRQKLLSDEAESRLDVAIFVNESLKDSQRDILDNEKSTTKDRENALLKFNKIQKASLDLAKEDVITFIELQRDESIKTTKLQIEGILKVAKAQKSWTAEQDAQFRLFEKSLKEQQALKKQGFDLDKIINAQSTKDILEQFKIQEIGEKFQLRIVELLQLERDQRADLSQIIQDNKTKSNAAIKEQLEFRLKANSITEEEINNLAKLRLDKEKKLLNDSRISNAEYQKAISSEIVKINKAININSEKNLIDALKLRQKYGNLNTKELDVLIDNELKKENELLESKLISEEVYSAKRKEVSDEILKKNNSIANEEKKQLIDFYKYKLGLGLATSEQLNLLAENELKQQKTWLEQGLINEEEYLKLKNDLIKSYTEKNIKEESKYREIMASPITSTLVNESVKQIENEVIKAGLLAYTNSLQQGKSQTESAKAGFTALSTAQIIKTFAKTAKKEGGTVMGKEGLVFMNEEGPEFVIDHQTSKSLGLTNNNTMSDFSNRLEGVKNDGYMQAMGEFSKKMIEFNGSISNTYPTAQEIGKEVANSFPTAHLDYYDKHIRLIIESKNKKHKEIVYKDRKRHL